MRIIKDDELDKLWSDEARRMFILLILSNLLENNDVKMYDSIEQTKNFNMLKNIISRNIDKFNYEELSNYITVTFSLNSDKQLKSINDIIHNSILFYEKSKL